MIESGIIESIKKIEIPLTNISLVNGVRPAKVSQNVVRGMKNYYDDKEKQDYRQKIGTLKLNLGELLPIDDKINNVVYVKNYLEKGIAINATISNIRQMWTEYRLLYNEQKYHEEKEEKGKERITMEENKSYVLENFDEIFDKLSKQIDSTDEYINKLSDFKSNMDNSTSILDNNKKNFEMYMQKEREKLDQERNKFEQEKREFEIRMEQEKRKMDENYRRLQELTNKFNNKVLRVVEDN